MREEARARARFEEEKSKMKPVYIYQCVVCQKKFKTSLTDYRHCDKLTQWVAGVEGLGINGKAKEERKIKVQVSGFIEMKESDFSTIMSYNDPVKGLIESVRMPFCDTRGLEFAYEE